MRGQPGERPGLYFPAELQIKITPSPFGDAESAAEREIISRVPLLYRLFMLCIVILPKMLIAGECSNGWLGRALLPTLDGRRCCEQSRYFFSAARWSSDRRIILT